MVATKEPKLPLETSSSSSTPLKNANPLEGMVNFLKGKPEFEGTIKSYPLAQILNDKSSYGLFLKQGELAKAGWYGLTHNGKDYDHTYNDGKSESGILFDNPNIVVISQSPRFIELTKDCDRGKRSTIVGIHSDEDGHSIPQGVAFYDELKEQGVASLRTFYLIYLFNAEKEALHKVPFCLSIKGVAASSFGKALTAFENDFYTMASSLDEDIAPLNQVSRSLFIWSPKFVPSLEPKDAPTKSWVAIVQEGQPVFSPIADSNEEIETWNRKFNVIRKANNNFANRFCEQFNEETGLHAMAIEGTNPNIKALPANLMTVDAEFDVSA